MVTPFASDGALDLNGASDLAQFLVREGSEGLVVAGSTGEGSSLSDDEKMELFSCVAQAVSVPVLAGSTFADTARSVALTSRVADTGVAGVLATTPAYARPSQAGLAAHLGAVAESTALPVMLYDVPARTGRRLDPATTLEVRRLHPNVVALKDASGDVAGAAHLKAAAGDDFALYSGDDANVLAFMAVGAVGLVSVAAHWAGPQLRALIEAVHANEWARAREINEQLYESYRFESSELYPNPMPAKAALREVGQRVGECRLPHGHSDAPLAQAAAEVVAALRGVRG